MFRKIDLYIRLGRYDRPIGIFLLLFPCWWGIAVAGSPHHSSNIFLYVLFALGATVMRGAGCTLNDLIDRDLDAQVERTKNRPLASGKLSPQKALVFFSLQSLIGLWVLLQLPLVCWGIGLIGLALLIIYPFMKRVTHWPQAVLGLAFNIGIFMGETAVAGSLELNWKPLIFLYLAGICWTIGYDTIYALQDMGDDLKVGIKSTAIFFGKNIKPALWTAYGLMLVFLALAGCLLWVIIVLGLFIGWRLGTLDPKSRQNCLDRFDDNRLIGFMIWVGLLYSA